MARDDHIENNEEVAPDAGDASTSADEPIPNSSRRYEPRITSFDDLLERSKFEEVVELDEKPLGAIVTDTIFLDQKQCGIKSCRTWHNRGYLVELESGVEVNVGNRCGRNHFGVEAWEKSKGDFNFQRNVERLRRSITEGKNKVFRYRETVAVLNAPVREDKNAFELMHEHMGRRFDEDTARALRQRAKSENGELKARRTLTADEEKRIREVEQETRTVDSADRYRAVGRIGGVKAPRIYGQLRDVSKGKLSEKIEAFVALDVAELSDNDDALEEWGDWASEIEAHLTNLGTVRDECLRFLVPSNIELINLNKGPVRNV